MLKKENIPTLFRAISTLLSYARRKKVKSVEMFYDQKPLEIQSFINMEMAERDSGIRVVYIRNI